MKKFRVFLVGASLIVLIFALLFASYELIAISKKVAEFFPEFSNMKIPMLVLCEIIVFATIFALGTGFRCLIFYGNGNIFQKPMLRGLQNIGLSFVLSIFAMILIIFYTNLNLDGSITNLFVGVGIFIYLLLSQIFFILSDLVAEGTRLKEENDLTI